MIRSIDIVLYVIGSYLFLYSFDLFCRYRGIGRPIVGGYPLRANYLAFATHIIFFSLVTLSIVNSTYSYWEYFTAYTNWNQADIHIQLFWSLVIAKQVFDLTIYDNSTLMLVHHLGVLISISMMLYIPVGVGGNTVCFTIAELGSKCYILTDIKIMPPKLNLPFQIVDNLTALAIWMFVHIPAGFTVLNVALTMGQVIFASMRLFTAVNTVANKNK